MVESNSHLMEFDLLMLSDSTENQEITLDFPIPAHPPSDKLLELPDSKEYEQKLSKVNSNIRKFREQLVFL